jgi:hypothetical protein
MLLTLPLLLVLATPADEAYAEGVAALKDKDANGACQALQRCIDSDPDRVECHWELGWARYIRREWSAVVEAWETVKRLQPDHPEVDEHLANAREQLALKQSLAEDRQAAPDAIERDAPEGATLRLRAVGDIMLGTTFPEGKLSPKDGAEVMSQLYGDLADADLTFVNLEGPLCDDGETSKCKPGQNCYAFRSPTRYVDFLLEAGVDLASTANNHSGDFGQHCRTVTEETLDKAGIAWSGRTGTVAHVEKNGIKVSMIGFHTGDGVNYVNDHEAAAALVKREAARSDVVIVSFHGGAEGAKAMHVPHEMEIFYGEKRGELRKFARVVIDAGADLVLGHGPHVLRGMEVYNDRLIAYSLGNFATYGRFNLTGPLGVGAILDVTLDSEGRFVTGKLLSTKQYGQGIAMPDKKARAADLVRRLSRQDFPSTHVVVAKDGTLGSSKKAARTSSR